MTIAKAATGALAGRVVTLDSPMLALGHTYHFKATGLDRAGHAQAATIAIALAPRRRSAHGAMARSGSSPAAGGQKPRAHLPGGGRIRLSARIRNQWRNMSSVSMQSPKPAWRSLMVLTITACGGRRAW